MIPPPRISSPQLLAYGTAEHPLAGQYVLEREIGSGGMAYVYLARDLRHDRTVAVKVLRPELASSVNTERFVREIQITAGLTHPHILPVHDSGSVDGMLYYVMPYVEGENLAARLARDGPLPLAEALRITHEIGAALQFAHDHGVVHRDIKPENVLLPGGEAVVADFGLARALARESSSGSQRLTEVGIGLGTPTYMSPEQGSGEGEVDARADQYSLACMTFEMLTGRPPFDGTTFQRLLMQHLTQPPPRAKTLRPELPAAVDGALARAMAKAPAERFGSMREFLQELENESRDRAPRTQSSRLASSGQVPRLRAAAIVLGVVVAALIGYRAWRARAGSSRPLDTNLVAVAPFEVFGERLGLWKEGLLDILAHDFDGAGPLRTVPPSTVMRLFSGRADRQTSIDLARRAGAGLVVYGQLIGIGADSLSARVSAYDVASDALVGDWELRDASNQVDRLADSIAVRVLRELGTKRSIAAVPRAFFAARSLPALKAFLQGEQFYRRNDFASAKVEYERALSLDSSFALALHRMHGVQRGLGQEFDSASYDYAARAGAVNHGTSVRDSLLILADSLTLGHQSIANFVDESWLASLRRRSAILESMSRQYPDDPEVWTELGELRTHYGDRIGIDQAKALDAFEHALKIDSLYGPAFFHAIDLTVLVRGPREAADIMRRYLQLNPGDASFAALERVLRSSSPSDIRAEVAAAQGKASPEKWTVVRWFFATPDALTLFWEQRLSEAETRADTVVARRGIFARRLLRGQVQDALQSYRTTTPNTSADVENILTLSEIGAISHAEVGRALAPLLLGDNPVLLAVALPWWHADTLSLAKAAAACEKTRARATNEELIALRYCRTVSHAELALSAGDSAQAVKILASQPDSIARRTSTLRLEVARLLRARGDARAAADYLDTRPPGGASVIAVLWNFERAIVAEQLGDRVRARTCYAFVAAAWADAGPELKRYVQQARSAIRGVEVSSDTRS